ncbi:hypothetical protein PROVRETT_08776 [Providencia rettgeri DSM 1131]|nr:hypothetical protein PROVRETT_08776 [Providencia rettgeri DSM 1131]
MQAFFLFQNMYFEGVIGRSSNLFCYRVKKNLEFRIQTNDIFNRQTQINLTFPKNNDKKE